MSIWVCRCECARVCLSAFVCLRDRLFSAISLQLMPGAFSPLLNVQHNRISDVWQYKQLTHTHPKTFTLIFLFLKCCLPASTSKDAFANNICVSNFDMAVCCLESFLKWDLLQVLFSFQFCILLLAVLLLLLLLVVLVLPVHACVFRELCVLLHELMLNDKSW